MHDRHLDHYVILAETAAPLLRTRESEVWFATCVELMALYLGPFFEIVIGLDYGEAFVGNIGEARLQSHSGRRPSRASDCVPSAGSSSYSATVRGTCAMWPGDDRPGGGTRNGSLATSATSWGSPASPSISPPTAGATGKVAMWPIRDRACAR